MATIVARWRIDVWIALLLWPVITRAEVGEPAPRRGATERTIVAIDFDTWLSDSLRISPDGRRVAFVRRIGDGQCVVVDGREGKRYDGIGEGTLAFSPDGRHVA